jgi:hypothetical protein
LPLPQRFSSILRMARNDLHGHVASAFAPRSQAGGVVNDVLSHSASTWNSASLMVAGQYRDRPAFVSAQQPCASSGHERALTIQLAVGLAAALRLFISLPKSRQD